MHLVQVLLPVGTGDDQDGFVHRLATLRTELIQRFGGATIYSSAPAEGLWKDDSGEPVRDRIVLVEVMTIQLDRAWWKELQQRLESEFQQEEVVIRSLPCDKL